MKNDQPFENDKPVRKLLRQWRVDAALPPRFQEQVWKRIENAETKSTFGFVGTVQKWLETTLTRPVLAGSYLAVFLVIGISAGCQQGQTKSEQLKSQLQARYVQMVDPYQTPR